METRLAMEEAEDMGDRGTDTWKQSQTFSKKYRGRNRGDDKDFYQKQYSGFNISHFTEKLNENEGIKIGREKVRYLLLESGLYIGGIDDATNEVPFALLFLNGTIKNLVVLKEMFIL